MASSAKPAAERTPSTAAPGLMRSFPSFLGVGAESRFFRSKCLPTCESVLGTDFPKTR